MSPRLIFTSNWDRFFVSHRLVLAQAAREAGFDVHVAVPPGDATDRITSAGFPVHHYPLSRAGSNPLRELGSVAALRAVYRRLRPALVHQVAQKAVLYGSMAARTLKDPPRVVNALAGMGYAFLAPGAAAAARRRLMVWGYQRLLGTPGYRLILQNTADAEFFVSRGIIRREQVVLIRGAGVDLAAFLPAPEPEGPPVAVLPARLLWDKGVGEFVAAARRLREEGVSARFALVGDVDAGNPAAVPVAQLDTWVAEGVIEWWGHRPDMPAVFAASHLVVLPSYREGLPKVLLEAAASGRPMVATDEPGCREVVRPGENGALVPVGDAGALADAMLTLIEDAELRRQYGAEARRMAEREFDVRSVVARTMQIWQETLA